MLLDIAVFGLATYAITFVFRFTSGPFSVFSRIRTYLGVIKTYEMDPYSHVMQEVEVISDNLLAQLVSCFWCLSFWVAFVLLAGSVILGTEIRPFYDLLLVWFASVGLSGFLYMLGDV